VRHRACAHGACRASRDPCGIGIIDVLAADPHSYNGPPAGKGRPQQ